MFKELFLSLFVGILVGIALFVRSVIALKVGYEHYLQRKYASNASQIADKYVSASLDDDENDISPSSPSYAQKFVRPPNCTDALFNSKSRETQNLRREFEKLFSVLGTMRDYVIRDFIDAWYQQSISDDDTKFVNHVKLAVDGALQVLVNRIASTNWTAFIRDRVLHPLRECLVIYKNMEHDLSKQHAQWHTLSEAQRDALIADVIRRKYRWHKACESDQASTEYLRKWSLYFVEEILDERNFHCFAVRFFVRELLTNNVLLPVVKLVDCYQINRGIISAFIYLDNWSKQHPAESTMTPTTLDEELLTMVDDEEVGTLNESLSHSAAIDDDDEDGNDGDEVGGGGGGGDGKEEEEKAGTKKRRASLDCHVLRHHQSSFALRHFFIEMNKQRSALLKATIAEQRVGYAISCRFEMDARYKFTIRFVSAQCIDLCARWVLLVDENKILGDASSLRHLPRIEYCHAQHIYVWQEAHAYDGDCYLQLGRAMPANTRVLFVPLRGVPLLHFYFQPQPQGGAGGPLHRMSSSSSTAMQIASQSISDGLSKIGSALNPMNMIHGLGDGISRILPTPNTNHNEKHKEKTDAAAHALFSSPPIASSGSKLHSFTPQQSLSHANINTARAARKHSRSIFGAMPLPGMSSGKEKHHAFHHTLRDIGFMATKRNKDVSKNARRRHHHHQQEEKLDEDKLRVLARHAPTANLTIRIWDVYRDFDEQMNPYVAYILRMRDDVQADAATQRFEWTIRTRFSKLHSFHRAIKRDKNVKRKNIKIVASFPSKTLITNLDAKAIAERKKQLMNYFNTLHRYPDVLLSHAVRELVIPPVLVQLYGEPQPQQPQQQVIGAIHPLPETPNSTQRALGDGGGEEDQEDEYGFSTDIHPHLPTHATPAREESPSDSLPFVCGDDAAAVASYYAVAHYPPPPDEEEEEKDDEATTRPRRHSWPCTRLHHTPPPFSCEQYRARTKQPDEELANAMPSRDEQQDETTTFSNGDTAEMDEKTQHSKRKHKHKDSEKSYLERFGLKEYEMLAPSLIKVLEAFLDLEKRSTFGSGVTVAATSMMSWFFNGYIANKLYTQTSWFSSMDSALSCVVQCICDLIWIPPTHTLKAEPPPTPTDEELRKVRETARDHLQTMYRQYAADNVSKLIGSKKQLELCCVKFWRFMQQNQLLKHLAFGVIDSLLEDLFPKKVSRRWQRSIWIANKIKEKDEKLQKEREKLGRKRERQRLKRLKQNVGVLPPPPPPLPNGHHQQHQIHHAMPLFGSLPRSRSSETDLMSKINIHHSLPPPTSHAPHIPSSGVFHRALSRPLLKQTPNRNRHARHVQSLMFDDHENEDEDDDEEEEDDNDDEEDDDDDEEEDADSDVQVKEDDRNVKSISARNRKRGKDQLGFFEKFTAKGNSRSHSHKSSQHSHPYLNETKPEYWMQGLY